MLNNETNRKDEENNNKNSFKECRVKNISRNLR